MRISDWSSDVCSSDLYDAADVVVINTCGFIDAAVEESLDAIGEAMAENGKVVVTGCLGAGPKSNIIRAKFPDALSVSGPQDYRSEESRVGKEWVSKVRYRWSPDQ